MFRLRNSVVVLYELFKYSGSLSFVTGSLGYFQASIFGFLKKWKKK
jgi:hypothetical protein